MVQSGKITALAVTSAQRLPEYPDVPPRAVVGSPGVGSGLWGAL
jgi:tripartite-type tricarboxylate transporter receptor subunit TctC